MAVAIKWRNNGEGMAIRLPNCDFCWREYGELNQSDSMLVNTSAKCLLRVGSAFFSLPFAWT